MLYGSAPLKPVAPPKVCVSQTTGYNGPQAYTYSFLAKQPGSDYKIRIRDMERMRVENLRMKNVDDLKSLQKHARHIEMIVGTDKKSLYNQIKRMVDNEMIANEHLFLDEPPKPEIKVEEEIEPPTMTKEDLYKKAAEIKKQKEDDERKLVEEKRLQWLIENSEELRIAAMEKHKNDIDVINYKIIQEKEKFIKEQKINNRKQANLENLNIFKNQAIEREEERRKINEKKERFRIELNEQLQEKEAIRNHEKELKNIETNHYKKMNEKIKEDFEQEYLDRLKERDRKKEEIKQFLEDKSKLFSQSSDAIKSFNDTFALTMRQYLEDDTANKIAAQAQLKYESDMFKKHQAIIKIEKRRQSELITQQVLQQMKEIEELKRSVELQKAEVTRKRTEEANKAIQEQIQLHEKILEEQKIKQKKIFEEAKKEHEEYLKEEKQLCENKNKIKLKLRTDLKEQIKYNNYIIENQRKMDMENHQNCMKEIAEQENLVKKLIDEL